MEKKSGNGNGLCQQHTQQLLDYTVLQNGCKKGDAEQSATRVAEQTKAKVELAVVIYYCKPSLEFYLKKVIKDLKNKYE